METGVFITVFTRARHFSLNTESDDVMRKLEIILRWIVLVRRCEVG